MIYVVGSICIDVIVERDQFVDGTSNPSHIRVVPGGVGYNIFRAISCERRLVTALGADPLSDFMAGRLEDPQAISIHRGACSSPPMYVAFMEGGELKVAASDVSAVEIALDEAIVVEELSGASRNDLVIIDANLRADTAVRVAEHLDGSCRLIFEPVSVGKIERHLETIGGIFLVTPDEEEFDAIIGRSAADSEVYEYLRRRRIENILVTRGKRGLTLYTHRGGAGLRRDYQPRRLVETADSTGAGDILVANIAEGVHAGADLSDAIPVAMARVESFLSKEH